MVFRENFELSLIFMKFLRSVYMHLWGLQIQLGLTGLAVLVKLKDLSLAGLTMPVWWKCRGLTKNSPWSSRLGVGQWFNNPLPQNLCITETETTTLAKNSFGHLPLWSSFYVEAAINQQFTLDHSNSLGKIFPPLPRTMLKSFACRIFETHSWLLKTIILQGRRGKMPWNAQLVEND